MLLAVGAQAAALPVAAHAGATAGAVTAGRTEARAVAAAARADTARAAMPSPADGAGVEVRVPADTTRPAAPSRAEAAGVEVRVPADTTHAAAPSRADAAGVAPPAAPDTARVAERTPRRAARDSASFWDQPRWVMLRSVALPGWGQLHNGSWLKALVLGGGEIALGVGIVGDWRSLDRLSREAEAARVAGDRDAENAAVAGYNRRLARVVGREWLLGGWMVYTLMDAYVDANFRGFHVEFKHDPALPEGAPAPAGVRLSLRWDF